jgi:hypothetical protein
VIDWLISKQSQSVNWKTKAESVIGDGFILNTGTFPIFSLHKLLNEFNRLKGV